jgi:hypothetical protein
MPTINFDQGPQTLSRYDVVGQRAEGQTRFVKHVGLLDEDNQSLKMGDEARVLHMGPPLEVGGTIKIHVAGRVPLTNDEIKIISTWFEKIKDEYPRLPAWRQYVIHPPWKDRRDPNNGSRRYRRYSCAGFVLDGHRQVNIELLDTDEDVLPAVDRQTIISAYPEAKRYSDLLLYWGLKGNGSWKVVLAGYVMHALNRLTDQIRQGSYRAKEGDEQF